MQPILFLKHGLGFGIGAQEGFKSLSLEIFFTYTPLNKNFFNNKPKNEPTIF
jgi:hypothetical protein